MLPGVAAIETPMDAVDLNTGPDRAGVARIKKKIGDLGRAGQATLGRIDGQLFPVLTTVPGTKDTRRFSPNKDNVRVVRMHGNGPDLFTVGGGFHQFPDRTLVLAPIQPHLGTGIHHVGVVRRHNQ